ncbi:MAG: hypothetical protein K2X44_00915 [Magnetospirillum sp.]|nr:hypothetical protein [Magnetospirillum sp.]
MQSANPSLIRIIAAAVNSARSDGLDYVGATRRAVETVQAVEPDLTPSAVLKLVEMLRPSVPSGCR